MKELEWNASTLATDLKAMPSWLETIQIIRHFDVLSVAYSFTSTTILYFCMHKLKRSFQLAINATPVKLIWISVSEDEIVDISIYYWNIAIFD